MKSPQKKTTIMMPTQVIEVMKKIADNHRRSFNAELVWALELYIEDHKLFHEEE